jgi:hypothetical protein
MLEKCWRAFQINYLVRQKRKSQLFEIFTCFKNEVKEQAKNENKQVSSLFRKTKLKSFMVQWVEALKAKKADFMKNKRERRQVYLIWLCFRANAKRE